MIIECYLMEFIVSVQLKTYSIFRWIIAWRKFLNTQTMFCNCGLPFLSYQEFPRTTIGLMLFAECIFTCPFLQVCFYFYALTHTLV